MRQKMSLNSRRELLVRTIPRYRVADSEEKGRILDEFVSGAGYHRKYALTLLNREDRGKQTAKKRFPRLYDEAVRLALITVWKAANRICSKRLMPFLPEFVDALERFGHLSLPPDIRERLLSISPATADRLLYRERHPEGRSISTTRPGKLLKHQIAVRTFANWSELAPGFMEADLVAHCGNRAEGAFLNTLVLTDIATGWTECVALLRRTEADVSGAIHAARQYLPFPLLGLDTDNGGEFINYELLRYCNEEKITFTRSRAYRKNDQAHVEEKNGSIVRRLIGYDRYEGLDAWKALTALYRLLRLYVNFFQPSMKLLSRERLQGHTTKHYDKAQTPYQRLQGSSVIGDDSKSRLLDAYQKLDPVVLLNKIEVLQDEFWKHAHERPSATIASPVAGETISVPLAPPQPVLPPVCSVAPPAPEYSLPRMYRRTRKPTGPRTWRTRKDPFADVWKQVQLQFDINPSRTAKELFVDLQQRYPGRFSDGQLRTLQRRVQQRRREQLYIGQKIEEAGTAFMPALHA
jgi:hypothetical protein